jgi:hypothetical protein
MRRCATVLANPTFMFHLKNGLTADLPAMAVPITDEPDKRRFLAGQCRDTTRDLGIPNTSAPFIPPPIL